jgi:hypothetical protein
MPKFASFLARLFGLIGASAVLSGCCGYAEDSAVATGDDSEGNLATEPQLAEQPERSTDHLVIEESDLYQLDGDTLYVLNQHTGLNVVDVTEPRAPELAARLDDLAGVGGELYVRPEGLVALVEQSILPCTRMADVEYAGLDWLAVSTVKDPNTDPEVVATYCLPGGMVASRFVGDVLYVMTSTLVGDEYLSWVFSLDATALADLNVVETETMSGLGYQVHVTDSAIYLAHSEPPGTRIRYIDISSGDGSLVERGSVVVPGTLVSRFHLDEYQGTLRVVTQVATSDASQLTVVDVGNPDDPTVLSAIDRLAPGERLFATRFDGEKAYVVTYRPALIIDEVWLAGDDPLWVISLENPAEPRVLGHLEIPGWSDYIFPRGDLLLAVGRGANGNRVAASLFDVSDLTAPQELRRLEFGLENATSEASSDFRGIRIIEEELGEPPLIVVPYSDNYFTGSGCFPQHYLQLIDLEDRDLRLRGKMQQSGRVYRTLPVGGELYAVTSQTVSSNDVSDRDVPHKNDEVSIGDSGVADPCVLPPPEPTRTQTVMMPRGGGNGSGDTVSEGSHFCACTVDAQRSPCTGRHAWWLLGLAALGVSLRALGGRIASREAQSRRMHHA